MLQAILLVSVGLSAGQVEPLAEKPKPSTVRITQPGESPKLVRATYSVADLIVPIGGWFEGPIPKKDGKDVSLQNELMNQIRRHVAPESWGEGRMDFHTIGQALVVTQTAEVQAKVFEFLEELRRLQDREVSLETRFLMVTAPASDSKLGDQWTETLSDSEVKLLLERLEQHPKTNIMQSPKITVFNGQRATMCVADDDSLVRSEKAKTLVESRAAGIKATYHPAIRPDNKSVRLYLNFDWTRRDSVGGVIPVKATLPAADGKEVSTKVHFRQPRFQTCNVERTFIVGDGQSVLIHAGEFLQVAENEPGEKAKAAEPQRELLHVLILVTPRIITAPQPEQAVPVRQQTPPR